MKLLKRNRREPLHPIHLYSAGYLGTKREPMTWMRCPYCGYRTLWSPYEPAEVCEGRWKGPHERVLMVPMTAGEAMARTAEVCDHEPELIRRTLP